MSEEAVEAATDRARARTYPLNSRRLTADVIGRIAEMLGLPTTRALEDTRQILDRKLAEMSREPRNVQVDLMETEDGLTICLRDGNGMFLEVKPTDRRAMTSGDEHLDGRDQEDSDGGSEGGACERGASRETELEAELFRVSAENAALKDEVSTMKE